MDNETQHGYRVGDRFTVQPGSTYVELEGQVLTVSRLDDEIDADGKGYVWAETTLVHPLTQLCFHVDLITPVPLADFDVIDLARAELSALDLFGKQLPLCEQFLHQGIRHLQRNVDMDCSEHEDDLNACVQPDRYDGDVMARLLNLVPDLIARIDALEAR